MNDLLYSFSLADCITTNFLNLKSNANGSGRPTAQLSLEISMSTPCIRKG